MISIFTTVCFCFRFNDESEACTDLRRRELRIAGLCMGQQSTGGVPLWKHDIIVVTAGQVCIFDF